MRTVWKVLGFLVLAAVVLIGAGAAFLAFKKPAMRPPSTEKIEATPERLARGEYLLHHVSSCLDCHSDFFADRFGTPVKPGTEGQGGFPFDKKLGVPGLVQAQNITPDPENGIGNWTDGEVIRAIREGVDRKGVALFPMMPYENLRYMSDEDVRSVVAYLRTLKPIKHVIAPRQLDFPVGWMIKFVPKPVDGPIATPDPAKDGLAYGKYLVTISGCGVCHTPHDDHGKLIEGREFSGGWVMVGPWGRVVTANLTPDPDAYLGKATKEEFIGRFKAFVGQEGENAAIATPGLNTVMNWGAFSGLTNEDLGAIYDYLKTVKPIANKVVTHPDAPKTGT
jgi:mono/diheme cytochrome c family protein